MPVPGIAETLLVDRWIIWIRCSLLALVCFAALAPALADGPGGAGWPADVQQVLKRVPDDARLVFVVPSLERLEQGLTAFGSATGARRLASLRIELVFRRLLGQRAGALRPGGPLALARAGAHRGSILIGLRSPAAAWNDSEPAEVLADGSRLYELGEHGYLAAVADGTVIIAREKAGVSGALHSTGVFAAGLPEQVSTLLPRGDVILFADIPAWRSALQRQLRRIAVSACMGTALAGPDAEAGAQAVQWFLEQMEQLLGEAQGYVLALHFDDRGLYLQDRVTFAAGGKVAGYLSALRTPRRDLLRGLPSENAAVVFSAEWNVAAGTPSINEALVRVLLRMESLREQVGAEVFDAALQKSIEAQRHMSGYSGVIGTTADGEHITFAGLYLTATGAAVQRNVRTVCEMCPELMTAWGTFASAELEYAREHVGEVEADVYRCRGPTADLQSPPVLQAFYGADSALYLAPHPEGVAYAMAPRAAARNRIKTLLAGQAPPLSSDARVRAVLDRLSPDPQVCLLVDVPKTFNIVAALAADMGLSLPTLRARAEAAPLAGLAVYLEPSAIRSELFLPSQPIRAILKALAKRPCTQPAPDTRPAHN